ncbi:MAG: GTP-binding protein [Anaerolineae bacterium]|nr:GTP-binding protein [Anaerolineae bacterium]
MVSNAPGFTTLKIVMVGAPGVGKSSLLHCYSAGREQAIAVQVNDLALCTLRLTVEDHPLQVSFWDVTGLHRSSRLRDHYFQGAQCMALIYDVSLPATFFDLLYWMQHIQSLAPLVPALLIGNKVDLGAVVPPEEAQGWAESRHMPFVQTSARTRQGVDDALSLLLWLGLEQLRHREGLSYSQRPPSTRPAPSDDEG